MKKDSKLIIFFSIFCLGLFFLYFLNHYSKLNSPKIILKSITNPLKVSKPTPLKSNMSLEEINQSLIELELKNDRNLEIDDIE